MPVAAGLALGVWVLRGRLAQLPIWCKRGEVLSTSLLTLTITCLIVWLIQSAYVCFYVLST
jgi:hypothetical protein